MNKYILTVFLILVSIINSSCSSGGKPSHDSNSKDESNHHGDEQTNNKTNKHSKLNNEYMFDYFEDSEESNKTTLTTRYTPDYLKLFRASDAEDVKYLSSAIGYTIDDDTGKKDYIVENLLKEKQFVDIKFSYNGTECHSVSECMNLKTSARYSAEHDAYAAPLFITSDIYNYSMPTKVLVHLPRFKKIGNEEPSKKNVTVDNIQIPFYKVAIRYDESLKKFDLESNIQRWISDLFEDLNPRSKRGSVDKKIYNFIPTSVIQYVNKDTYNVCVSYTTASEYSSQIYRDSSVTKNLGTITTVSDLNTCPGINTDTTLVVYHRQTMEDF